jgi:hypothetical protein
VASKIVDVLVEEFAYATGYTSMLADGSAVALANLYHLAGPRAGDPQAYERLLQAFVDTVRWNSKATVDDLFDAIAGYRATVTLESWAEHIEILALTRVQAEDAVARIAAGQMKDLLDPAVPCLPVLVEDMGRRLGDFRLVHDESKTIARHAALLLTLHRLPDPARPGRMMPRLPLTEIAFSDSRAAPQLQIADWVAGAARQCATRKVTERADPFAERLDPLVEPWTVGGIWPDREVISNPRRR